MILQNKDVSIISEIKFASPSKGKIRSGGDLNQIAREMERGGVTGISILCEPEFFGGHINFIKKVRHISSFPILMKDFILKKIQIDAAAKVGASAVLLIQTLYDRDYGGVALEDMIDFAHAMELEVLLEVHNKEEYLRALQTDADMIGINNRDLKSLQVNLNVTHQILTQYPDPPKIIVSESGIFSPEDIRFLLQDGVKAFLIGTSIMQAPDIATKLKELVKACETNPC